MAEKESKLGILDGRFTHVTLSEVESNYLLSDILKLSPREYRYEKLQKETIGDKSDIFNERYGDFKDIDDSSVYDAVLNFDSTRRVNNEKYSRGNSNYESNIKIELNNRKNSNYYMKHKFLMGSKTSNISTLSDDEYEKDCIRRASNGKCDDVLSFCRKIEKDYHENRKKDDEVYSYSIHKKDGNMFTEIEYGNTLLDPIERFEIAEGCHISEKHKKDPYYIKLISDIRKRLKEEYSEVKCINYSPVKLRCEYLP